MAKVSFIGLGNMGYAMAKNIVLKAVLDTPLTVYNRTHSRAVAFSQDVPAGKVVVADTIAQAAAADIVFTMLSDDAAVESVVNEILRVPFSSTSQRLLIDCSTIHPDTTNKLAAQATAHGAVFVAAPVFGPPSRAQSALLISVQAGPKAAVERARPFFKGVTAQAEILLSDKPAGQATLLKLIGNTFVLNMIEQVAEGHVLAEKAGLDHAALHQLLEVFMPGLYAGYSQRMLSGKYYTLERPLFAVDLARKDLGHALGIARACGAPAPNAATADAHLAAVRAHDGETGDVSAVYGVLREQAGLPYGNQ